MNVIIQILNTKDVSQQVKKKILQLIQNWGIRFEDDNDVLPLFSTVYGKLKSRNLPFADEDEARRQVMLLKEALDGKAAMPDGKPLDKKHTKLRKDLEVVIGNIVLANEMIDAHDIDDDVDQNDALVSLIQSLRTFENKIVEIIAKIKNDHVMHLALTTNDDMQKTLKRYTKLERGRIPEKFKPECRKFLPGYKEEAPKPKAPKYSEPVSRKPEPKREPVKPKFIKKEPEPVHVPVSKPPVDDIFGGGSVGSSKPLQATAPSQSASSDIFGLDFSDTPAPTSSAPPKQDTSSNVSLLNDIMGKMNLNKQQEMQQQFNTTAPGMGPGPGMGMGPGPGMGGGMGPGMGPGPGMGGGMGGPGFGGPNPGMFNTGMPPPMMGGGGFGGPPNNFNTGFPGGGFNQPNPGFGGGFNQPSSGFGGGMPPSNDPFANNPSSIFSTAPTTNFNPGGGPDAFKNKNKPKKNDGPKEFTDLFGMANKISDRQHQPQNSVEDYVTNYKDNYNNSNNVGDFGAGAFQQDQNEVNDFFGGGASAAAPQSYGGGFDNPPPTQSNDGFGGDAFGGNAFGYQQNAPQDSQTNDLEDDFFGGGGDPAPAENQFMGAPEPAPSNDPFGGMGGGYSQPASSAPAQDDMFGMGGGQQNYGDMNNDQFSNTYNQPAPQENYGQPDAFGQPAYNQQPQQNTNQNSNQEELFDIFG